MVHLDLLVIVWTHWDRLLAFTERRKKRKRMTVGKRHWRRSKFTSVLAVTVAYGLWIFFDGLLVCTVRLTRHRPRRKRRMNKVTTSNLPLRVV